MFILLVVVYCDVQMRCIIVRTFFMLSLKFNLVWDLIRSSECLFFLIVSPGGRSSASSNLLEVMDDMTRRGTVCKARSNLVKLERDNGKHINVTFPV